MTQNRMLVSKLVFALAIGVAVFVSCKKYEGDTSDSASAERWRRSRNGNTGSGSGGTDTTNTPSSPTFSFNQITTDYLRPMSGIEMWNNAYAVQVPSGNSTALDEYYRFAWFDIETTTRGSYNWTVFDREIRGAIDAGRKFSFGVMPLFGGWAWQTVGGAALSYPTYLHNQMQSASSNERDWTYDGTWIPNWNSEYFLTAWENLLNAIAQHINTGSYNGVAYKNVINYIDVRGYGDFGEWHTYPWTGGEPSGRKATSATLKRLINSHITAFPDYPLVIIANAYDGGNASQIPADVTYYALTVQNNFGPLGWRRDNWGDPGTDVMLSNNSGSYNGVQFKTLIMDRWKTSPVVGEPLNTQSTVTSNCGSMYCDLENQIRKYHATSFGNGNYPSISQQSMKDNIIAASKATGARIGIQNGNVTISSSGLMTVNINWINSGNASVYQGWDILFQLKTSSGNIVWSGKSQFKLKGILTGTKSITDQFQLTGVSQGTYTLSVIIKDPVNYRSPYPLSISGRQTDGSYNLNTVTIN